MANKIDFLFLRIATIVFGIEPEIFVLLHVAHHVTIDCIAIILWHIGFDQFMSYHLDTLTSYQLINTIRDSTKTTCLTS